MIYHSYNSSCPCTTSSPEYFGDNTDYVIRHYRLPSSTHAILYGVESNCAVVDWLPEVMGGVPACSLELAENLAKAMREDCNMSP